MKIVFLSISLLLATLAHAQLRLPRYFSDHAVLQRDQPVVLWGWSVPGDKLSVTMADVTHTTTTNRDSIWRVTLSAKPAGGPYDIVIKGATEKITIKDIYFGDVFFCSGQSNMVFTMNKEEHSVEEKENFPLIRQFHVYRNTQPWPQKDVGRAEWMISDEKMRKRFSAVAYYFAKEIYKEKKIPVGIILSAYGGSPIEPFMSKEALKDFPEAHSKADKITPEFIRKTQEENDRLLAANPGIKEPKGFVNIKNRYPTMIYNGMIAPFFFYPVKGVLWYQGETNTFIPQCYDYEAKLYHLVRSWRRSWKDEQLPFYIVQLPNYGEQVDVPKSSAWTFVQEAQFKVSQRMRHVHTIVTQDVGDPSDIHPTNKRDVGKRIAAQVLKQTYGDTKRIAQGPTVVKVDIRSDTIELHFANIGSGLEAKGGGKNLYGFALAGKDDKFYRATAELRGDRVVVYSEQVGEPLYIRYAFESNPAKINFYNKEGFPAVPFRTDELKDATTRK